MWEIDLYLISATIHAIWATAAVATVKIVAGAVKHYHTCRLQEAATSHAFGSIESSEAVAALPAHTELVELEPT